MTPTADIKERVALFALCLAVAGTVWGVGAWWLGRNDLPDGYQNEFIHLFTLGEVFFRVRDGGGWREAWPFLFDEYYPPLLHAPALLWFTLAGPSRIGATLALGVSVLPLLWATGALARRGAGVFPASLAVLMLGFAPGIFGNLRRYEPNVVLAAIVAVASLLLLASDGLRARHHALGFGLLAGAGLLVDRVAFAVYLLPPVALLASRRRPWRSLALAAAATVGVAGYYYVQFARRHLDEVLTQLGGEVTSTGEVQRGFGLFSLRGLLYYPLAWIDGGFGPGLAVVLAIGLGGWSLRARRRDAPSRALAAVLEPMLLGGLVIFTLLGKRQPYYAIPLMSAAVVLASCGWAALLPGAGPRAALLSAVALLGGHQLAFLSTGVSPLPLAGAWATLGGASPFPAGWLGHEYVQAGPPFAQGLELERAARRCRAAGVPPGGTLLFSAGQAAYEGQVMPTLRLHLDSRQVAGLIMEPQAFEESEPEARCFVFIAPPGGVVAWPTAAEIAPVLSQWGYEPATPGLLAALGRAHDRARLLERWISGPGETVHVYALDDRSPAAPK